MEPVYTVVGKAHGSFVDKTDKTVAYAQLFTTTPFDGENRGDYHAEGLKAEKFGVSDKDVLKSVKIGEKVRLFFNKYGKVNYVAPADQEVK